MLETALVILAGPLGLLVSAAFGYGIGWAASRRVSPWIVPILLLVAAVALFATAGVLAGGNGEPDYRAHMIDLERGMSNASIFLMVAAGASASWILVRRPLVALILSVLLAGVALVVSFVPAAGFVCSWFGDCM
jgi:hypothetical protein